MSEVKLFVSVYKDKCEKKDRWLLPVSAGAALYEPDDFMLDLRDDRGDNISERNPQYCELTVQYYAWKNEDFDFGGLMHQRRYFDLTHVYPLLTDKKTGHVKPYRIYSSPDDKTLSTLGLTERRLSDIAAHFPVIAPVRENIYMPVAEYYRKNDAGNFDDLRLLEEIIKYKYPYYLSAFRKYLNGRYSYFCNMMIMKRDQFCRYSEWLFDILFEYEKRKPRRLVRPREAGKLAERLFGVYITYLTENSDVPCAELQRAHFSSVNGATAKNMSFSRKMYFLCPPGSLRRGIVRHLK